MNPPVTYALALQLIPRARDLMPDRVEELEGAALELGSQVSVAPQIYARVGSGQNPDQESGDPAYRDFQLVGRIKGELAAGRPDRARELLLRMNDSATRSQISELIRFTEAALAVEAHSEMATPLANLLRRGIKRTLIYTAMIASTRQTDVALQILPLAVRDAETLPAEQRVRLFAALSLAVVRIDPQAAMGTLDQLIKAYNDVYSSPRRGRFDPRAARQIYNSDVRVDASSDSSLILPGARGMYEAVQTERGRHNFTLKAPGVAGFDMRSFLVGADGLEPGRLEAAILGLRDETMRAASLEALSVMRTRAAKSRKY
jgi:hypothetical protein